MQVDERTRKGLAILFGPELWGGFAVILELISLGLPWWGITELGPVSSYYGVTSGPSALRAVTFPFNLDSGFSQGYLMTPFIVTTMLLVVAGIYLQRRYVIAISFVFSVVTLLLFLLEVQAALSGECPRANSASSCVTSLTGQGTIDVNVITWGFQAGFYAFMFGSLFIPIAILLCPTEKRRGTKSKPKPISPLPMKNSRQETLFSHA